MKKVLLLLSFITLAGVAYPQPPDPPDEDGPFAIPVDGGASLLAAAGIAYGIKRFRDNKATKKVVA